MDFLGSLLSRGNGADDEAGTVSGVATEENIVRVIGMLGFEEPHGEENEVSLDDFGFASFDHDGATTGGVGFPVYGLDTDCGYVVGGGAGTRR